MTVPGTTEATDPPEGREILIPGDASAGGSGRRAIPLIATAAGLALAIAGTLPATAPTWSGWSLTLSALILPDWAILTWLGTALAISLTIIILMIWLGRRHVQKGPIKPKIFEATLTPGAIALLVAIALLGIGLAVALWWLLRPWLPEWGVAPRLTDEELAELVPKDQQFRFPGFSEMPVGLPDFVATFFSLVESALGLSVVATFLFCVAALGLGLWRLLRWRPAGVSTADPMWSELAAATEESLDDLRVGGDPRAAIIGCYARFERSLAAADTRRAPWQTPMEFMQAALGALPLAPEHVERLTRLFELARFSRHPLGPTEQETAWRALVAIKTSLEGDGPDAATG
jgi:hypothetical protein